MRSIDKSTKEPDLLLSYRKTKGAYWDGFEHKDDLKPRLLSDQGYLCCYCMRRVEESSMKIEHYLSRSKHPEEELSWKNLLAVCPGGEGSSRTQQTCDTRKGDADLNIDPRRPSDMKHLRFLVDGRLNYDKDANNANDCMRDIDEILNLNTETLRQNRAEALKAFQKILDKRLGNKKNWSFSALKKELERIQSREKLQEFTGMFEWWLERLIRKRT